MTVSNCTIWMKHLQEVIRTHQPLAIAFSGGTDSTLLAKVAAGVPGPPPLLVHVRSALIKSSETAFCIDWAAQEKIELLVLDFSPFELENVRSNPPRRCYYCKQQIVDAIRTALVQTGRENYHLADGANLDDLGDYRPGMEATNELGVLHPLIMAGLDKTAIRRLGRKIGTPNCDAPAAACLASRISYGTELTPERLAMVATAEDFLTGHGFPGCRVRYVDHRAEIEVNPSYFRHILSLRKQITDKLLGLGFIAVLLNLEGYKQGTMNRGIATGSKAKDRHDASST